MAPPGEKVPATQSDVAPESLVEGHARPGRQGVHSTAPASATVPGAQGMLASVVASGQAKPAVQLVHVPLPSTANVPGRQGTRSVLAALGHEKPAGQPVQATAPGREKKPLAHGRCHDVGQSSVRKAEVMA